MENQVLFAFGLALFAALAMGIGSLLAFVIRRDQTQWLSLGLGFSGGVMLYVALMDLLPEAVEALSEFDDINPYLWGLGAFVVGMVCYALLEGLVLHGAHSHAVHPAEQGKEGRQLKIAKMGFLAAISIAGHNIVEGMAIFMGGIQGVDTGLAIASAVALHNIPVGIAVAIPLYLTTGSRWKAFLLSMAVGMGEFVGALLAYFLLYPWLTDQSLAVLFAIVAGMMVMITLDEILPAAQEYGQSRWVMYGIILGMSVFAMLSVFMGHHH